MGLLLSVIISYAGVHEAMECLNHIVSGMLPDTDPDFRDLVEYYSLLLQKTSNPSITADWTKESGQGYLCLSEDKNGNLKSATVKYYDGQPNSTAILFSTKISSFGQESVEDTTQTNGDYRTERYTPTKTKTILTNSSESFSVGHRNRSPTSENISDRPFSPNSFERDEREAEEKSEADKLTWHYRPKSPIRPTLPEIHFQSFEDDARGVNVYSEDFLRLIYIDFGKHASCSVHTPCSDLAPLMRGHGSITTAARVDSYFRSWHFTCTIPTHVVLFKIT